MFGTLKNRMFDSPICEPFRSSSQLAISITIHSLDS
jgi:hypothetical protein